jgi:hypothetical protein
MDHAKCQVLKERLAAQLRPQIVPLAEFFDGNDDEGSIGCNLSTHPGIKVFRDVLMGLLDRPDVQAVYVQISELDPGHDSWPFTDSILVVGKISSDKLRTAVSVLQPDEVGDPEQLGIGVSIDERLGSKVLIVWWD